MGLFCKGEIFNIIYIINNICNIKLSFLNFYYYYKMSHKTNSFIIVCKISFVTNQERLVLRRNKRSTKKNWIGFGHLKYFRQRNAMWNLLWRLIKEHYSDFRYLLYCNIFCWFFMCSFYCCFSSCEVDVWCSRSFFKTYKFIYVMMHHR